MLRPQSRVLSIACGHLREANHSTAVVNNAVAELVAFDQDKDSLSIVTRDNSTTSVRAVHGSAMDIVRKRVAFTEFDLVYSAGLFDYLSDGFGRRLLGLMVNMLRPGGRLLVANFTPDNHGREYMECFMDWSLICRNEAQMGELLGSVEPGLVAAQRLYRDELNNVIYLEIDRA